MGERKSFYIMRMETLDQGVQAGYIVSIYWNFSKPVWIKP